MVRDDGQLVLRSEEPGISLMVMHRHEQTSSPRKTGKRSLAQTVAQRPGRWCDNHLIPGGGSWRAGEVAL